MKLKRKTLKKIIAEVLELEPQSDVQSGPGPEITSMPFDQDGGTEDSAASLALPAQEIDMSIKAIEREKRVFKSLFKQKYGEVIFKYPSGKIKAQPKEVRISPADPLQPDITKQIGTKLIQDLGYKVLKVIPPKQPGAMSSRLNTYQVSRGPTSAPFIVIFAGANKGQKFEEEVRKALQSEGELGDSLLTALGLSRNQVISVSDPAPARKRPLTIPMRDDGAAISDITLVTADGPVYLSIKNPKGRTYSNPGYGGAIKLCHPVDEEGPDMCEIGKAHDLDVLLSALNVDKNKIVQGINDFSSLTQSSSDICAPITLTAAEFDTTTVAEFLKASFGYGYVYARHEGGTKWKIMDLRQPEMVTNLIGEPISATITYARYNCEGQRWPSSKGTRIAVTTSTGGKFDIAVRNKSGSIIPNQMAISISKYPKDRSGPLDSMGTPLNESKRHRSLYELVYGDV